MIIGSTIKTGSWLTIPIQFCRRLEKWTLFCSIRDAIMLSMMYWVRLSNKQERNLLYGRPMRVAFAWSAISITGMGEYVPCEVWEHREFGSYSFLVSVKEKN